MARLSLSKSSLSREQRQLKSYRQFLPSLDLKRRQLIAERAKAEKATQDLATTIEHLKADIARELPMLADRNIDLSGLVKAKVVRLDQQNVVGTWLPVLASLEVEVRAYSPLAKPHWVDTAAAKLQQVMEETLRLKVAHRRLELLDEAVRIITQRVNLFDKVLIPRARANIKKIQIYLSDAERDGVVRAKIAKKKTAARAATEAVASL